MQSYSDFFYLSIHFFNKCEKYLYYNQSVKTNFTCIHDDILSVREDL